LIPFLNKAIIIANFHICGNLPVCREQLKIISRGLQTVDADKANLLNTFFCSISEIIDSDLPTPVFDKCTERKLDVFNITIEEIKDVLLNLKLGKAVGNEIKELSIRKL
jgi:hypothetical protein